MLSAHQSVLVVDTPQLFNGIPIKMAAKRYVPSLRSNKQGLTLLFAHGGAAHKEIWEPIIELLLSYQAAMEGIRPIREIWSLDWPSHGESAVLNASALRCPDVPISAKEWAVATADFCQKYLLSHRVACIGHCAGAYTLLNATRSFGGDSVRPYELMILVEPSIIYRRVFEAHRDHRQAQLDAGVRWMKNRHQEWNSREEAFSWLRQRTPWNSWDPRVLRIFVEYGLCPVHEGGGRVTLASPPHIEARNFSEVEQTIQGIEQMEVLCDRLPIHVLLGEYNDIIPDYYNDCVSNLGNERTVASVTVMPGVGHIIPQEKPDDLAKYIWRIILRFHSQRGLPESDKARL